MATYNYDGLKVCTHQIDGAKSINIFTYVDETGTAVLQCTGDFKKAEQKKYVDEKVLGFMKDDSIFIRMKQKYR